MPLTRLCAVCGRRRPTERFYLNKQTSRPGQTYRPECKDCHRIRRIERQARAARAAQLLKRRTRT